MDAFFAITANEPALCLRCEFSVAYPVTRVTEMQAKIENRRSQIWLEVTTTVSHEA